ncbi:hypothetical protein AYO21_01775 [Fonsecaea monophora]|uniref:Uncharacterized protein n=1 Tax=Fonsecaea monophora TaxID=254056 RepID=A0A177FI01_9EURO|nr:hypothetical protein AYO21_01775 [Fonsecaea monophora]KAH0831571.1 Diacetyl reductase [(S)-acetoin forming] [Fonsecaea pedrosoi]OAG43923.1 hypothetical protein AYO21_01775 [Fonsecaea monophora]
MPAKVAIVTGGASGIGLAVVEYLVNADWSVTIVDLNTTTGAQIAERFGDRVLFVRGNVAVYNDQVNAFALTEERWGQVDFVFANAGIVDRLDFCRPAKDFDRGAPQEPDSLVIDVDLKGVIWSSYLALHFFRKNPQKGGKLVMTSSSAGLYSAPDVSLYSAAKYGVVGLARSLGQRLKDDGEPITINAICPGAVPTAIFSKELADALPSEVITPTSTIVEAIKYILQDATVTGQAIECSGREFSARPVLPYLNEAAEFTSGGKYKELISAGDGLMEYSIRKAAGTNGSVS